MLNLFKGGADLSYERRGIPGRILKVKKMRKPQAGFTLIELVLVIALLGVLAATALPQFFSINLTNARNNSRDAVVGAVQAGLGLYAANQISLGNNMTYPNTLDAAAAGSSASATNRLFTNVLQNGMTSNWTLKSVTGGTSACYDYTANTPNNGFSYTVATGVFVPLGTACP